MSFFGPPTWVQSVQRNVLKLSTNVDCTVTTIGYGDVPAVFTAHYVVPGYNRLAVYGSDGIVIEDDAGFRLKKEGQPGFTPLEVPAGPDALVTVLDEFGESLLTGKPFETTGDTSILVVAAAEAAIKSAAQGGRRVTIDEVMR
jgi:predicted dehydrogenase